jgi:hypothetical protein
VKRDRSTRAREVRETCEQDGDELRVTKKARRKGKRQKETLQVVIW